MNNLISIVIVNYNTQKLLEQCLRSIVAETQLAHYEMIVVDNGSTDGSVEWLRRASKKPEQYLAEKDSLLSTFHGLTVVYNRQNVGFGQANNQGVKASQGELILLLNSDTEFIEGTLDAFWDGVQATSFSLQKTVFGCKILNPDGSVQPSVGYFPTLARLSLQMLLLDDLPILSAALTRYQQMNIAFYATPHPVDWVTGAWMFLSKHTFLSVQGFDPQIFMYGEEVDLAYRLKQKQYQVLYLPIASVIHYKGQSSVDGLRAAVLGEYEGLKTFYKKHYPQQLQLLIWILRIGAWLRIYLFSVLRPSRATIYKAALTTLEKS